MAEGAGSKEEGARLQKGIVKKIDIKKYARPTNQMLSGRTADALSGTNHIGRPDLYAKKRALQRRSH